MFTEIQNGVVSVAVQKGEAAEVSREGLSMKCRDAEVAVGEMEEDQSAIASTEPLPNL